MPYPLGRIVQHDLRSLAFQIPPRKSLPSVLWTRRAPIFDQGQIGSCTGNAAAGLIGTDWLHGQGNPKIREKDALGLYELATTLDDAPGSYPPDDTGSSGLAVAKACQQKGLIKSYTHAIGVDQLLSGLQDGPMIVGTDWLSGMDSPDAKGLVHAKGSVRGGHEYLCLGWHADTGLLEFCNSWGVSWGRGGHFFVSLADFTRLLKAQGDATALLR